MPPQRPQHRQVDSEQLALIPESQMEFPIQRRWAVSIFVLLQAWKLMDLFLTYRAAYPGQFNNSLQKWYLLDTFYLIALYIAKIPWLQFSTLKTLLLIGAMCWFNLVLFALPAVGLVGILPKGFWGDAFGKQTSVSQGRLINVKDVINNNSHILGRHTVHILPYGTAKLNPNDEVYCLPPNEIGKKDIYIPIILNNTIPRSVSIARHDFDTGIESFKMFSGKDIQRATEIGHAKQGVEYYYIRVRQPGAYKLNKITSQDGVDVRLYHRRVFIFTCPNAQFKPIVPQPHDYCTGNQETLQIQVSGVAPLRIEYQQHSSLDDKPQHRKLDRIQPEGKFESPLQRLQSPEGLKSVDPAFFASKEADDYKWAAVQHLDVQLNLTFDTASKQEYMLMKVVDGAGNIMDLSQVVTPSTQQAFQIHARPAAFFQCSQTDPVNLLIGSKSTQLPLKLKGTGPFQLEYDQSGSNSDGNPQKIKLSHGEQSISVTSPGEYNLLSISDKYCQGQVMFPSSCQVVQPAPPSVKVLSTPIASECAGDNEIGMKFVAEFVGAPPYVLEYVVTKQDKRNKPVVVERKRESIDRSRHIFSYLPASAGEYTYEFTLLDDRNYKKRPTHISPIKQVVHPQPDARFSPASGRAVRTCLGEDVSVDVNLQGTGPFELSWTVDGQLYSDAVESNAYTIKLPPFDGAGNHIVSLVKIQDANACIKDLESRDFAIDVRRDRPTAFFYTGNGLDKKIELTEGSSAQLPLRLTGEGPWAVTYRNVEGGDRTKRTLYFNDPNANIKASDVGHYELLSVEDSICKGDVLPPQFLLQHLSRPTVSIPEEQALELSRGVYERAAVCQGASDAIDIAFTGLGPFYCSYKEYRAVIGSRHMIPIGDEEITTGIQRVRLPLKTKEPGKYRYTFEKLSDQRYTEPFALQESLHVEQIVHAMPTVIFNAKSQQKERKLCVGESLDSNEIDPIWLEFTGVAPFSVEVGVSLSNEQEGRIIKLDNIASKKYKLVLDDELNIAGTYQITLLAVNDANNCGSTLSKYSSDNTVIIKALDIPLITTVDNCQDICVGDNIEFGLAGMGPFTVNYLFNGKTEQVKSGNSRLGMIADKPGNITIVSVGDQRNKCKSYPKDMTRVIHEVPSSFISGGKEIVESIREGDMVQAVVDLVGTAPFDFEWRRSRLIWDDRSQRHYKGEVLESHTVYGVEEHQYLINTSVEGIIEIVSIKDKYCQYPI